LKPRKRNVDGGVLAGFSVMKTRTRLRRSNVSVSVHTLDLRKEINSALRQ